MGRSHLPAVVVGGLRERPPHRPAVLGLWPLEASVAAVQPEHRVRDAQAVAAQGVVVLGVVGDVAQHPAEAGGLADGGSRRRRPGAGTIRYDRRR